MDEPQRQSPAAARAQAPEAEIECLNVPLGDAHIRRQPPGALGRLVGQQGRQLRASAFDL